MSEEPRVLKPEDIDSTRKWSDETFGPGKRTNGVLNHIRKELNEIEQDPNDLMEWVDVMILALDGATRAGYKGEEILDALYTKWDKNRARVWPDWRNFSEDEAIEHDRTFDAPTPDPDKMPFGEWCICAKCGPPFRKSEDDRSWRDQLWGSATWMSLCPSCGNKRCPRAVDHNLECSNSNDPDQPHLAPIPWAELSPEIREFRIKYGLFSEDTPEEDRAKYVPPSATEIRKRILDSSSDA